MCLGVWKCDLKEGSIVKGIYKLDIIMECYCYCYEYNNEYCDVLENVGLVVIGINLDIGLVEIVEIFLYFWFVGV